MNRWAAALPTSLILVLAACGNAPAPAVDKAAELKAVTSVDRQFYDAVQKKDAAGIGAVFAADGMEQSPGMPTAVGPAAIQAGWAAFMKDPNLKLTWTVTTSEVAASGDLAYEAGTFEATVTGPDGKPFNDKGKFLAVLKKVDGQWKFAVDADNSDLPMVPAPAPAAAAPKKS